MKKGVLSVILFIAIIFSNCTKARQNDFSGKTETPSVNNDLTETVVNTEPEVTKDNAFSRILRSDPNLTTFKMVSSGSSHTLAIKTDGSLWAWGRNDSGQLGDGTTEDRHSPVQIGNDFDWKTVCAGWYHSKALKTDGSLWSWGAGYWGIIGDGTETDRLIPTRIGTDTDWAFISAGSEFTMAIKTDGSLWGWGSCHYTELGNGRTSGHSSSPERIGFDNDWVSVFAGERNTLAIKSNGTLWSWGEILSGANGGEGEGLFINVRRPTQVGTDTDWVSASVGYWHRLAIKKDGTLWAWGGNLSNQMGNGGVDNAHGPVKIGNDNDWVFVSTSLFNSMAIKKDGSLWAWGMLGQYDYIHGEEVERPILEYDKVPVRIWGETNWEYASASAYYGMAIMKDGSLWSWGDNEYGCLGDGTTETRLEPVQIGSGN